MRRVTPITIVLALLLATPALAAPITYTDLAPSPGGMTFGTIFQPRSNQNNPDGAVYFRFQANAGDSVILEGMRLDFDYDMSSWVFFGEFGDTNDFGPSFDGGDSSFAQFADDQIGHPGPFGDPRHSFVAPQSGIYTLAVTNFLSTFNVNPPFDFKITAVQGVQPVAVPEPVSLGVWSVLGLAAAGFARRRRK